MTREQYQRERERCRHILDILARETGVVTDYLPDIILVRCLCFMAGVPIDDTFKTAIKTSLEQAQVEQAIEESKNAAAK